MPVDFLGTNLIITTYWQRTLLSALLLIHNRVMTIIYLVGVLCIVFRRVFYCAVNGHVSFRKSFNSVSKPGITIAHSPDKAIDHNHGISEWENQAGIQVCVSLEFTRQDCLPLG